MTADVGTRLANRILWGLLVGAAAGGAHAARRQGLPGRPRRGAQFATLVLDPIGQVFLRMLFFVVIPLVFASLATGVAQLDRLSQLGPMAVRTFILFFLNMAIAVTLGLVMMNLLEPGAAMEPESRARLLEEYGGDAAAHVAKRADAPDVTPMSDRRDVHAAEPVRRLRRQQPQRPRRRAAADPVRDPGRRRRAEAARRAARPAALRAQPGQRADDRHRALRTAARALCRAGDDLQRRGQDRLGHRHRARRVRRRLHHGDAAAPVRHHVGVAAPARAAQPARDLQAHAAGARDRVLDQLERGVAADGARGGARGPRRARARSPVSCCRSARP